MEELRLATLMACLLSANLVLPAVATSKGATAERTMIAAMGQPLFECHTDRSYKLRRLSNGEIVGVRRAINGDIRLTVDGDTRSMTLYVQSGGKAARTYVLKNVEQGSSPGSGASGRADTTIRGEGEGKVFTLFAGYENHRDNDAALQVGGRNNVLLVCGGQAFSASAVKGPGSHGSTNIFTLSAHGLAKEMRDRPVEPEFERYP